MEWVQGAEHNRPAWVMQFQAGREDVTDKRTVQQFQQCGKSD